MKKSLIRVATILMGVGMFGCKSVHTEIVINAEPEKVWHVLSSTDQYPDWNPTFIKADGRYVEGEKVKYRFKEDEDKEYDIESTVKKVEENKFLNQQGGMWGIITFDHQYKLEKVSEGTKLIQHEKYAGLYVPFWNPDGVEAVYERANVALKSRVEGIEK